MTIFNTYGQKSVQQIMFPVTSQQNLKDTTVSVKSCNTSMKLVNIHVNTKSLQKSHNLLLRKAGKSVKIQSAKKK